QTEDSALEVGAPGIREEDLLQDKLLDQDHGHHDQNAVEGKFHVFFLVKKSGKKHVADQQIGPDIVGKKHQLIPVQLVDHLSLFVVNDDEMKDSQMQNDLKDPFLLGGCTGAGFGIHGLKIKVRRLRC